MLSSFWFLASPQILTLMASSSSFPFINARDAPYSALPPTQALQAAVDDAYAKRVQAVYAPGRWVTDGPVYLDAPGNLRANINSPTIFNFSLALIGDGGLGNQEGFGSQIAPISDTFTPLIVGPGQGMAVRGINIIGPGNAHRKQRNPANSGIAISGGLGGAVRTQIQDVCVANYYNGITTGFNMDQLAEENTFTKVFVTNCFRGLWLKQTQNFINGLYDCNFYSNTNAIVNPTGVNVNIDGGDYSGQGAFASFGISSVSAFTAFQDIYGAVVTNYHFTAIISTPDWQMQSLIYDSAVLLTQNFGHVPLRIENFDVATSTATFSFLPQWLIFHFGAANAVQNSTDLFAELQACTSADCCELITIFSGGGFRVRGIHVENQNAVTTLIETTARPSTVENSFFDYQISCESGNSSQFNCQQQFPFVDLRQGILRLRDNTFEDSSSTPQSIVIDVQAVSRLIVENCALFSPNIRYCDSQPFVSGDAGGSFDSKAHLTGEFDISPFYPQAYQAGRSYIFRNYLNFLGPSRGLRPEPLVIPCITPTQLAAVSAKPLGPLGSYVPLNGETIYKVMAFNAPSVTPFFIRSTHYFYSYGQDLRVNWSYKGGSAMLNVSGPDSVWLFPGLLVMIDNGVNGLIGYIITGTHAKQGYVTVCCNYDLRATLFGDSKTIYSGNIMKQEVYTIEKAAGA